MSNILSKGEWESWCKAFGEANQTKIVFCRTHDLNYHQFLYWCTKFNKKTNPLIPVRLSNANEPLAIIRLGNGSTLEVVSRDALNHIISSLM